MAHPFFAARYQQLTAKVVADIARQQDHGWVSADADPERIARAIIGCCEGLQLRWLHQPTFDLHEEFVFVLHQFGLMTPADEARLTG